MSLIQSSAPGGFGNMLGTVGARYAQIRAALADRTERRRKYRQTLAELRVLSDRELADIGIPRAHIRRVALEEFAKDTRHEAV